MAIEQYTESLTLQGMNCTIGENEFGFVFPQGDISDVEKVERLLKKAGGKPKVCASTQGTVLSTQGTVLCVN